ncbi:trans-resveratrol di-O-methyltransferase-like [Olea europaea var. sylvestris]|uniref:trans-resveratrol di-O-methyltransferase-like n=1 Tax=Olea europaea var. sylvestris TaxID=158386 RepID=UPI000C1CEF64|nr:trans-resveratrol di-O-methyltransferase-like [Olea europaea var. sylvestris]
MEEKLKNCIEYITEYMNLATHEWKDVKENGQSSSDAGFTHYKIAHKLGYKSLIEVYPEWFENNEDSSAFETAYGKTFWDYGSQEPKMNLLFNKAMASDTQLVSNVVTRDCKQVFEKLKSIVDVGGGTGSLAKAIVDSFPDLQCVVFDLPHVIAGLEGTKNLTYVGGNMFETIPRADALLLKCILHDWSDEDCVKILKKCREAIPCKENGGKVIIIDIIVGNKKEDHKGIETQLFYDMSMMVWANGRERTEKEWAKLFFDAGFTRYNIVYGLGLRSIIEVYP